MPHILVVEDKYESRYLLKVWFEGHGFSVSEAENGLKALEVAHSHRPDIVISDVLMPDMDGFELCQQWMSEVELKPVPFVFYSATYTTEEDIQLALDLGAVKYIIKPQEPETLLKEINEVLQNPTPSPRLEGATTISNELFSARHEEVLAKKLQRKITQLEETNRKLRISEQKYYGIFNNLQDIYIEVQLDGTFLDASPKIKKLLTAYSGDKPLSEYNLKTFFRDPKRFKQLKNFLLDNEALENFEATMKTEAGELIPSSISASLVRSIDEQPKLFALMIRDISRRKAIEGKLSFLSQYDNLTGLPNRSLFRDRLDQAIIEAKRHQRLVCVMMIDIDGFKNLNDTLGHQAGDQVLIRASERLQRVLRASDTVSRFSGDEFALLLADMSDADDVALILAKIINTFSLPIKFDEHELFITLSMGITVYPDDENEGETLIRSADIALNRAKQLGSNNYQFYTAEMTQNAKHKLLIEQSLQHAVERDELILCYQPQACLISGKITGMEALVRWNHPQHGMIPPNEFIPLAEETGLIIEIGQWVLKTALQQLRVWHAMGYSELRMAVNMSSRQLREETFFDVVRTLLNDFSMDGKFLELELTESMLLANAEQTIETLNKLKQLGVSFSIDDFGTGYSSLSYLKKYPITVLKIDRSFVLDINHNQSGESIVQTIINMAHTLGMKVVAEGVETLEHLKFLNSNGCDFLQGYYFSKPVLANEFSEMLKAKKMLSLDNQASTN